MSEQYRFMRYYLPGALFLMYLMILTAPYISTTDIPFLKEQPNAIIGIFTGAFVISPVIGYVIYGFYNYLYECLAMKENLRPVLKYLRELKFEVNPRNKKHYQEMLQCNVQKKEFLDLIYHSDLKIINDQAVRIDSKILETLKGHLSAFAARVVCGFFVPIFCILIWVPMWLILGAFDLRFTLDSSRIILLFISIIGICIVSTVLLLDSSRVLFEAFQLEDYFIKSKEEVVKVLLKKIFLEKPKKK